MKILKLHEVEAKVGLKKSSIHAKIQRGEFPKQISLGTRSVGWLEAHVDSWIAERVRLSHGQAA